VGKIVQIITISRLLPSFCELALGFISGSILGLLL
jgi:hypothetical protein